MWVLQPHDRHLLTQVFLAEYTIVVNHQNFWKGLTSLFSEENGRNMVCQDGKKLVCYICGSFDHMLEVALSLSFDHMLEVSLSSFFDHMLEVSFLSALQSSLTLKSFLSARRRTTRGTGGISWTRRGRSPGRLRDSASPLSHCIA